MSTAPVTTNTMASAATNGTTSTIAPPIPQRRHIWIVTGPAGCGKSTVGEFLSQQLQVPYLEGDSFHPASNIAKMAAGTPLTDADRWDWLILLREQCLAALSSGSPSVVLACSALKRKYRDVLRIASYNDDSVLVHFVYLAADMEMLLERVRGRVGHYMKDSMVRSQFEALEVPDVAVEKDVRAVDVKGGVDVVRAEVMEVVREVLAGDIGVGQHVVGP